MIFAIAGRLWWQRKVNMGRANLATITTESRATLLPRKKLSLKRVGGNEEGELGELIWEEYEWCSKKSNA